METISMRARERKRALARYSESYSDFGPTLTAESLAEEGLLVPVSKLRLAHLFPLAPKSPLIRSFCVALGGSNSRSERRPTTARRLPEAKEVLSS